MLYVCSSTLIAYFHWPWQVRLSDPDSAGFQGFKQQNPSPPCFPSLGSQIIGQHSFNLIRYEMKMMDRELEHEAKLRTQPRRREGATSGSSPSQEIRLPGCNLDRLYEMLA